MVVLRERHQHDTSLGPGGADALTAYPEGRHQRPRGRRAPPTVNPQQVGTKAAAWFTVTVGPGAAAELRVRLTAGTTPGADPLASGFVEVMAEPPGRGRRVLRARSIPPGTTTEEARDRPPGVRGAAVEPAVLPLRRRPLDRRRSGRAAAAARAGRGPQRGVAPPRRQRRHRHARHLGVPVVRVVGPRLPLRRARPRRSRRWPSSSCCCSPGSGTSTPTASCPPTSGTSPTPTRRCTPGRPCGCSRSTAAPTGCSSPG